MCTHACFAGLSASMLRLLFNAFAKAMVVFSSLQGIKRQKRITATGTVIDLALSMSRDLQQCLGHSVFYPNIKFRKSDPSVAVKPVNTVENIKKHGPYQWLGRLVCFHVFFDMLMCFHWPTPLLQQATKSRYGSTRISKIRKNS